MDWNKLANSMSNFASEANKAVAENSKERLSRMSNDQLLQVLKASQKNGPSAGLDLVMAEARSRGLL